MPRPDHRRSSGSEQDPTAAIRQAIVRLTEQRQQAAAEAGRALVTHAEVTRAVRDQRVYLARVTREIDAALGLAADAAARARADAAAATGGDHGGDPDEVAQRAAAAAAPYELTRAGLRRQREVVVAATEQLEHLDLVSGEQIARTRALLQASVGSLDEALREQLRLLVALERAERARLVAAARSRFPSSER